PAPPTQLPSPYTPLFRSDRATALRHAGLHRHLLEGDGPQPREDLLHDVVRAGADPSRRHEKVRADQLVLDRVEQLPGVVGDDPQDRKSTRLNSSHSQISY